MTNAEYQGNLSCPQRDSAEHEGYAGAQSVGGQKVKEQDGADLLERILSRDNLCRGPSGSWQLCCAHVYYDFQLCGIPAGVHVCHNPHFPRRNAARHAGLPSRMGGVQRGNPALLPDGEAGEIPCHCRSLSSRPYPRPGRSQTLHVKGCCL